MCCRDHPDVDGQGHQKRGLEKNKKDLTDPKLGGVNHENMDRTAGSSTPATLTTTTPAER